ncbi:gag-pol polyprotein [Tanacetum coccineum]
MAIPRNHTVEEAQNICRDRQIKVLQEQIDRVLQALEARSGRNRGNGGNRDLSEESSETNKSSSESDASSQRRRRNRKRRDDSRDIKVDRPNFKGSLNRDEFLEWVQTMDKIIMVKGYDEKKALKLVVVKLKKYASLWFENVEHERRLDGKKRIKTWSKLKECMKKRFVPHSYKQELYIQMSSLKQGTKEVVDYIWEFEQLKIRTNVREAEEYTIARFIWGLNPTIAEKLEFQPLWMFEDACKMAITMDKQAKKRVPYKPVSRPTFPARNYTSNEFESASKSLKGKERLEKAQCPNQRALTLKEIEDLQGEIETEDEQPVFDESNEEEMVGADFGDMLVVRRAMHTVEAPKDKTQRENIFHSRCTIKGKVCSLIIDGGSCANAASTYMVEKLGLSTMKHPHPYKLQWLSQGNEVKVTRQVIVPFSMGTVYHDEITCDVVPMDACHLLLGRPWLFDKHVYHNGHLNTYSLFINGKKITLTSLKPNEISKVEMNTKSDKGLFMSQKEVVKELESGTYVLALLMCEKDEEKKGYNVPSLVKPLLSEFADVFLKELPPSLPPIRGIEHQIDLVPGSILPNKAAYRCSPHEAKELQKQVDELVAQGRAINNITIKYRYPIPRLDDMLDELYGSCVFSKIDLRSGTFMRLMNEVLRPLIGKFVVVYFDDILVYSKSEEEHLGHLRSVFDLLRKHKLYGKLEKCDFMVPSVVFLGYVVSKEGISMDPSKVEAIKSWPTPSSITEGTFEWHKSAQEAFEYLKDKLSSAPILALPNFDMLFELECDASGVGIGAVLVQEKRLVAYFSEKLNGSKLNYSTYDKEFYAMKTMKDWDLKLSHAEFAFNRAPNYDHGKKFSRPKRSKGYMKARIEKANEMYKAKANKNCKQPTFSLGDLVWIHLRKERFPSKRKNKLMPKADGTFKVLERFGDSAYKVELPGDVSVSSTFNIGDLMPYLEDDYIEYLRSSPNLEGEDDVGVSEVSVLPNEPHKSLMDSNEAMVVLPAMSHFEGVFGDPNFSLGCTILERMHHKLIMHMHNVCDVYLVLVCY